MLADLRLGEVLLEAQAQDLALALGQHAHQPLHRRGVLGDGEAVVLGAERVDELALLVVVVAGPVERDGAVGAGGLARLEHLLGRGAEALGDLARRRRAAELAAHVLAHAVDLDGELLEVARHAHRPALVTKVTLELAEDGGDGERGERRLARGVEALDGLQQPERGDLDQVVERLAGALVAARKLARERQEALDQRLAGRGIGLAVVALEQAPVLERTGDAILRARRTRLTIGRTRICSAGADCPPARSPMDSNSTPLTLHIRRTWDAGLLGREDGVRRGAGPSRSTF